MTTNKIGRDGNIISESDVKSGDNSFNVSSQISQANQNQLSSALTDLQKQVEKLMLELQKAAPDKVDRVERCLDNIVAESKETQPQKSILVASRDGLIEAAKAVAGMAEPIKEAVEAVIKIVTQSSS